jgi:transposase
MTTSPQLQLTTESSVLHMAIELSASKWKLAFADRYGRPPRIRSIDAGDFVKLRDEMERARKAFDLEDDCRVISCYEAGRDGFWVHRCLVSMGVKSLIVEPASIEVNRRKRRPKTDRLDAGKIVSALMRFLAGDRLACRMVRVPDIEAEDARHLNRDMRVIKSEKTAHTNRIKSLLAAQGITDVVIDRTFPHQLNRFRSAADHLLLNELKARLRREFDRLALAVEQIRELQKQQAEMLRAAVEEYRNTQSHLTSPRHVVIAEHLLSLGGIGPVTAWTLSTEVFSWRDIQNRRQLAALAGLTPTPHDSGDSDKQQGISKSGRGEIRALMIEIAWGWLQHQPDSELACWYRRRFADGTKRNRKIGIVALARKLLVALGKYVRHGEIPAGANLSDEMKFNYLPSLKMPPKGRSSGEAT